MRYECKRCGEPIHPCIKGLPGCYWKGWVHEATALHGCGEGTTIGGQVAEPAGPPMPTREPAVPVTIRRAASDPAKAIEIMLVENCQRRDLGPVEKAEAMGALRERGYTATAIARAIGVTVSTVSHYLAYLDLDTASRERVRNGTVKTGDAIRAVRRTRQAQRGGTTGRPAHIAAPWFTTRHRLAKTAQAMCGHTNRPIVGRVACGQCWEQAIREDALTPPEEPSTATTPSPKEERMQVMSSLRMNGSGAPAPGTVTAGEAAERLGVSRRTVERYKRELAGMP